MKLHTKSILALSVVGMMALSGCVAEKSKVASSSSLAQNDAKEILTAYANIAWDNYQDALKDAKSLQNSIEKFASNPTEKSLQNAKNAWLNSRESYGLTESFRLSNGPIDAEEGWISDAYGNLESQINAWPLDENMIDYTLDANMKKTSGNIIDSMGKFTPSGEEPKAVNISKITPEVITALNENGGEANVASGYHAIEFLLWGQDQDYQNMLEDKVTHGAMMAGLRPLSDFTSDINSVRRLEYLKASAQKLVDDLILVSSAWNPTLSNDCSSDATGCYRAAVLDELKGKDASKNINQEEALKQILAGMGMFIKSELANERIAVAVLTPSEEDEHSCFSDNTHRDLHTNYFSFKNLLTSTYNDKKYGKSLFDTASNETKAKMTELMGKIEARIAQVDKIAKTSRHFDYQIRPDDPQSKEIRRLKNDLRKLGDMMILVAKDNKISISQADITDPEETKVD